MNQDIFVIIEHIQGKVADISYIMLAAARDLSNAYGGQVTALLLGHEKKGLAAKLAADKVIYFDHPGLAEFTSENYLPVISAAIDQLKPRVVLLGSTSIGADLAGTLSIKTGLPLVNSCVKFTQSGQFTAQICGGKIMAEGVFPEPTALATVIPGGYRPEQGQKEQAPPIEAGELPALPEPRVTLSKYIEPETADVDISRESVLIAVGRGLQNQDNLELAEQLAKSLKGTVCASRPVVDQGWLPTSRLVGKSGKYVKPKLYLALGISGAPEHSEAIMDSELIIAVNTDPRAPIFNIAKYGIEMDMFDLLDVLNAKLSQ
jgi:electron transfer flavoprotein alpha subunit